MSKTPTPETLEWAATWLEEYDGQGDEAEDAMTEVAAWLRERVAATREAAAVRQVQAALIAEGHAKPSAARVRQILAAQRAS